MVLTLLSRRKRTLARLVPSGALLSDGHLSGVGAAQAAVALVVGFVAVAVAISTLTATPIITAPERG